MSTTEVELTYFKKNGKYYSSGNFSVDSNLHLYDVWELVFKMKAEGKLPGLVDGCVEFHILITRPGHDLDVPHLVPLD